MKRLLSSRLIILLLLPCCLASASAEGKDFTVLWEGVKNALYNYSVERFLEKRGILTEDPEAFEYANQFLSATLEHDVAAMKALFAPNAITEIGEAELDAMLNDFIDYVQADSYTPAALIGPQTSERWDHGKKSKELAGTLEIIGENNTYQLAIKCISRDDWEAANVGIWSIYIIDVAKDIPSDQPYRGDLKYTSGIYFDVPRPER